MEKPNVGSRTGLKDNPMISVTNRTRSSRAEKSRLLEILDRVRSNEALANSTVKVRHD